MCVSALPIPREESASAALPQLASPHLTSFALQLHSLPLSQTSSGTVGRSGHEGEAGRKAADCVDFSGAPKNDGGYGVSERARSSGASVR